MSNRVALVSAEQFLHLDEDLAPVVEELERRAVEVVVADWHDDSFAWERVALAVVRSTWDYTWQFDEFMAWAARVDAITHLANPLPVLRWNTDKRYLMDLTQHGVPVVPTTVIGPDSPITFPEGHEVVVKPTISAGSRDTERYRRDHLDEAEAHVTRLRDAGREVLVQPYLPDVDTHGESGLVFVGDRYSHAFRKGPILRPGSTFVEGLYREEEISPRTAPPDELDLAHDTLDAVAACVDGYDRSNLLYARVDVARHDGVPVLMELELVEPSLFCGTDPNAASRVAEAIEQAVATLRR